MKRISPFRLKAGLFLAGIMALLLAPTSSCAGQDIKVVPTRTGVTVRVLLNIPDTPMKGVLVIFPGGDGANMFKEGGGQIHLGKNFLVRTSPQFVRQGLAVAIVDVPSDQPDGISAWFRNSPEHVQDIAKVISFLDAQGLKPIYLAGTSMGTLSVAYLGMELKDSRVKGLILTSTVTYYVSGLPLSRISLPTILVHHRDDGCKYCLFRDALSLKTKLSSASKVDFVEVLGGSPPQSDPCQAMSYHGFLGREDQVVQVIADWIAGKPVPAQIGN